MSQTSPPNAPNADTKRKSPSPKARQRRDNPRTPSPKEQTRRKPCPCWSVLVRVGLCRPCRSVSIRAMLTPGNKWPGDDSPCPQTNNVPPTAPQDKINPGQCVQIPYVTVGPWVFGAAFHPNAIQKPFCSHNSLQFLDLIAPVGRINETYS
jgi:hypothetical protein